VTHATTIAGVNVTDVPVQTVSFGETEMLTVQAETFRPNSRITVVKRRVIFFFMIFILRKRTFSVSEITGEDKKKIKCLMENAFFRVRII
jgi:hypothetical protein